MRQSSLLILNTSVTYLRMALTVVLGLWVVRLLTDALGWEDFGLLATLGASGALLVFLRDALRAATMRHLAAAIGAKDETLCRATLSGALAVFAGFALAFLLFAGVLYLFLDQIFTIPAPRLTAARIVFVVTALQIAIALVFAPISTVLIAAQRLVPVAVFELIGAVVTFGGAWWLTTVEGDRMIAWKVFLVVAFVVQQALSAAYVWYQYAWAKPSPGSIRWATVKELMGYAGWSVSGALSLMLAKQGSVAVLNIFYGNVAAGAMNIALRGSEYQTRLSGVIAKTVSPAVTTAEGGGNRKAAVRMAMSGSKLSVLTGSMIAIPLLLETQALLTLWLGSFPEETVVFTRLIVAAMLLPLIGGCWYSLVASTKRIGVMSIGGAIARTLPMLVVVLCYAAGIGEAWWLAASIVLGMALLSLVWLPWYGSWRMGISKMVWVTGVVWPVLKVWGVAAAVAVVVMLTMPEGLARLLVLFGVTVLVIGMGAWMLALTTEERGHFVRVARGVWAKLSKLRRRGAALRGKDDSTGIQ